MRVLYHGLLDRLGIRFNKQPNRGGHEAKLPAQNTDLKFIPSSFLKQEVMQSTIDELIVRQEQQKESAKKPQQIVFVAGLGHHHAAHCVSLRKHSHAVTTALDFLDRIQQNKTLAENHSFDFHPIWFGVPAQPINRHLFAAKPIGQGRKDCRSNARHLLYSSIQQTLCHQRSIPFIDAFALTASLSFTTLDGTHYYSFARDAMLDSLADELRKV